MATRTSSKALADVLFPEPEDQQAFAEGILSIPPEQRKLHTETYDFTVDTMVEKIEDGSVFVPDFQRRYVWTDGQASRLIESLIIQCPIPVIYLNQEADERLSVIDGNQRLTSIRRFLANEFALKALTAYPELVGSRMHQLDSRIQRHIKNRTLRCIVILKDTHPQVKFDVFERLNTGAVKLTPQELRHGLYFGDLMHLATEASKSAGFVSHLEIKNDKRMKAEELVLRFWALSEDFNNYRKPLAGFINSFADSNRSLTEERMAELRASFSDTLDAVISLFGDLAFKIFDANSHVESSFNAALYDAEMLAVHALRKSGKLKKITRRQATQALASLFLDADGFRRSISIATSDESQMKTRVNAVRKLLST